MIDWSFVIALIALVVSVLCPLFTAIVNNRHEIKVRRDDHLSHLRSKYFEDYLEQLISYINDPSDFHETNLRHRHYKAIIYANDVLANAMNELLEKIDEGSYLYESMECFGNIVSCIRTMDLHTRKIVKRKTPTERAKDKSGNH